MVKNILLFRFHFYFYVIGRRTIILYGTRFYDDDDDDDDELTMENAKDKCKNVISFLKLFEKHIRPLQSLLYLSPVLLQQNKSGLKLLSSHFTIPQNNFIRSMPLVFLYPQKNP